LPEFAHFRARANLKLRIIALYVFGGFDGCLWRIQHFNLRQNPKETDMTTYNIPDMSCGHCKATVEKTIHSVDPAAKIAFDMPARQVSLETSSDAALVLAELAKAGYPAAPA
tara:strand:+ start:491 stop:826 length:336 start_codon:yes stop_codon:yes gene_type:complete